MVLPSNIDPGVSSGLTLARRFLAAEIRRLRVAGWGPGGMWQRNRFPVHGSIRPEAQLSTSAGKDRRRY